MHIHTEFALVQCSNKNWPNLATYNAIGQRQLQAMECSSITGLHKSNTSLFYNKEAQEKRRSTEQKKGKGDNREQRKEEEKNRTVSFESIQDHFNCHPHLHIVVGVVFEMERFVLTTAQCRFQLTFHMKDLQG